MSQGMDPSLINNHDTDLQDPMQIQYNVARPVQSRSDIRVMGGAAN
jgi:hypothetical protein